MVSYSVERKLDRRGEFGRGSIEGVAGPEAANNAAVGAAYVPLMALGIPVHAGHGGGHGGSRRSTGSTPGRSW